MKPRERVIRTLQHQPVDRAPRDLWALPAVQLFQSDEFEAVTRDYPMDIGSPQTSPGQSDKTVQATARVGTYTDDWGSVWHVAEPGVVGEVKGPALADWSGLAQFQAPWHLIRERDRAHVEGECASSDLFMLSECTARPFERLQFLRGTEDLFVDLAYGTAEVRRLLERVHDYYLEDIRWWCATPVDGVLMMDDWGTNRALLISPAMWRDVFKPLYRDYCAMIHDAGKHAFFHTDGHTEAIYGDLIEVGMDAINSQLFCMDIEELGRRYRGRVTFWGEIDRQHVLPFGTPDDVRQAVLRVRRALDGGHGGVIAQCEWGKHNPRENIEAMFDAWLEPLPEA